MLKLNKKVEYALIALVEMDTTDNQMELVTAKSLAERFHIPSEILGKVLQLMVKTGLLFSVQGVKGGYTLARPLSEISILQLINAIEGEIALASCLHDDAEKCAQYDYCTIRTPLEVVQSELEDFFSRITVQDIKRKYNGTAQVL